MTLWGKFAAILVLACFTTAYAQESLCTDLVKKALATVETACAPTGRNQACYGNVSLTATLRGGISGLRFEKQGDLADVADLASLQLQPLDADKQVWGVALMKLQASLPDTLPGQNVTFILFGDVRITNAVTPAGGNTPTPVKGETPLRPMQAFYFSTGIARSGCAQAPDSGILIQTPKGAGRIALRANDVDVELGSTAYLRAQPAGKMTVSVVEGEGILTSDGKTVTVPAGTQAQIPLDADLHAEDVPDDPQPYDADEVDNLPVDLMPDDIEIAPPSEVDAADETEADAVDTSGDFMDNADDTTGDDSISEDTSELDDTANEDTTELDDTTSDESLNAPGDDSAPAQDDSDSGSSDDGGGE